MANFVFAKYNSMPEQVEENKENIKKLCGYIKESYKTSLSLNDTDTTIAISDTNADASTINGWLFDANGKLFKITSGDGVNLLIEFYTNFKGTDGHDGADDIDDSTTAINKLWSSDKTNNEIINAKDKGVYYTKTQPTIVGVNLYFLNFENEILNINSNIPILEKDLLFYIDANDKVAELYRVTGLNSLIKIGDIGGGKQTYQHNIQITNTYSKLNIFPIINDDPTPFTAASFRTWLLSNGYSERAKYYGGSGWTGNGTYRAIAPLCTAFPNDDTIIQTIGTQSVSNQEINLTIASLTVIDDVFTI